MFNEGHFWERSQAGEFQLQILKNGHPSPPRAPEPICTHSQIIAYYDAQGQKVALVHQYVRRNGALGGSGRPDPRRLLLNGVLYAMS